jgi:beta-mannosidase
MARPPIARRTRSLDGDDWWIRPHLGIEAALAAAIGSAGSGEPQPADVGADLPADAAAAIGEGTIHAVHQAADLAAGWLPARVPGSLIDDVHRAGLIPDPGVEQNSLAAEWIPERAWTYRRTFVVDPLARGERAWLRFDGIDHAGFVVLDGTVVARHEGMFVPLEVEVSRALASGGRHELAVVVEPAPEGEPQVGRTSRVRIHKARMSYGWDFCPRLVHQGLWQPVGLITAGAVRIADAWARPTLAPDLASATVTLRLTLDVADGVTGVGRVTAELLAPDGSPVAAADLPLGDLVGSSRRGNAVAELTLAVDRPALWWPNGLGEPVLHRLIVRVLGEQDAVADERSIAVGFRRIEREPNPGAAPGGRPWQFVVNGRPMEVAGWNWTPVDALYGVPRPDRLDHLLRLARTSHANLLRVWGGGLIETDAFYDACDRLGLLVWQEFSQSSSGIDDTPSTDPGFVDLMRREAETIVPLRRNHPSLAVWCGGNELQDADGPLEDDRSPVLAALHDVVARLDPDRIWLPTSPTGRHFANRLDVIASDPEGLEDVHGPWEHQGLDQHHLLWDVGTSRFNAEFGVEGMANRRTHERLIRPEHRWPPDPSNPVYRHLGSWWNNAPFVAAAFGGQIPEGDLEMLRRASQWLQAEGLAYAIEANRRRWPRTGGSIPWQLHESFPNAWCTAVVDHRGDPKPAFYAAARAFAPALVCARFASPLLHGRDTVEVAVVAWSRDGTMTDGEVTASVVGVDGAIGGKRSAMVDLRGGSPVTAIEAELAAPRDLGDLVVLDLALRDPTGSRVATNRYVLARGADLAPLLDLAPATLAITRTGTADAWCLGLENAGGVAAIGVDLADDRPIDEPGWAEPADSGLILLPGERRTIAVRWADAPADGRRLRVDGWNVGPVVVS